MSYKKQISKIILFSLFISFPTIQNAFVIDSSEIIEEMVTEEIIQETFEIEEATNLSEEENEEISEISETITEEKTNNNKSDFDQHKFVVNMLTNYNAISQNDGLLKTGLTGKAFARELAFGIVAVATGALFYAPTALEQNVDFKNWPYPNFIAHFCAPAILTYLVLSFGYQYVQKSKINVRILNEFIKNWKYHKQITPEELHYTFDPLYTQYLAAKNNLDLSENEAQKIVAKIFKMCVGKGSSYPSTSSGRTDLK